MCALVKMRLAGYVSNYTKHSLTSDKHYLYSLTRHKDALYNLSCCRMSQTLHKINDANFDLYYIPKLATFNKFSTTCALGKSKDRGKEKKKTRSERIDLNELGQVVNTEQLTDQLERAVESFKDQMIKYLALRSNVGAIEAIRVKYDGDEYALEELAQISRKPKMVVLNFSAFPQTIPDVIQSLSRNQMNLNPQQEGTTLYIPIPKVTKEHRENLSKNAKAYFVKCRDNIRDVRNKYIKDTKKQTGLPSDLVFRVEGYIDILSNQYVGKAEKMLETKQKELLGESE